MTSEREFDVLLRSWFDGSAPSAQPEGLLESVVTATAHTRPRPGWLVRLGGEPMPDQTRAGLNRFAPLALAATAVVVAVLIGIGFLVRPPNVGPSPVPGPTDSRTPEPTTYRAASWTVTGSMFQPGGPALLLPDGKVLAPGGYSKTSDHCFCGAQLYDPATGSWTETGDMIDASGLQTVTLLLDGNVLVTSSESSDGSGLTELYDPATESWIATGSMAGPRQDFTATRLLNGKVLVAGGFAVGSNGGMILLASAESYDPGRGSWIATGSMAGVRAGHTATLLPDGRVLVTGGSADNDSGRGYIPLASAELYDPSSGSWTATGNLVTPRYGHTATLLPDGMVLVAGGRSTDGVPVSSAELYDPRNGSWIAIGSMIELRAGHTATLLPDGMVLVAGGWGDKDALASTELYDPAVGTWTATATMVTPRAGGDAILLHDGRVLVAGGDGGDTVGRLWTAELYGPGRGTR